ncbi:MAG: PAS domain S-box protein [Syntrophaceae bacterium]|nr:PAS domain S-box protein [Syntrophaceae bacterium]
MKKTGRSITGTLSVVTAVIALLSFVLIPTLYFVFAYQQLSGLANTEAEISARALERRIAGHPASWRLEATRLQDMLERRLDSTQPENRTILDLQGGVIAEVRNPLKPPTVKFQKVIYDSGSAVAFIEIEESLAPIASRTAVVALFAAGLSALLFAAVYFLSLRLQRAKGSAARDSHDASTPSISPVHDLAERRRSDEALRESENKYRLLTEKMTDIVWTADMNLKTTYVTPSVEAALGYTQEERMAQSVDEQFTPESLAYGLEAMARELALEKEAGADPARKATLLLEYYHKDGSTRWMETIITGLRDEQGKLVGLHGVSRDVTQRKLAEDALRASEERFKSIVSTSQEWIWAMDLSGRRTYCNAAVETILGYRPEDTLKSGWSQRHLHEEDAKQAGEIFDRCIREKKGWTGVVWRWKHRDGTFRHLESNAVPVLDRSGQPVGFQGADRDITDRIRAEELTRQSEEKFRKVFMASPDCMVITRLHDGLIMDVNAGFEKITGWPAGLAMGRTSLDLRFWHQPADRQAMIQTLTAGEDVLHREFQFRRKDGEVRIGAYGARTLRLAGEDCLIFHMQDITDRRRMEEERQILEQRLFQAQKMDAIGQLAGGVAHDFNNMLGVIIGNTEIALDHDVSAPSLCAALKDVRNAAQRSADLTRQLLAFARKQTIRPQVLDLNVTVTGMLKMLQRLIGENIRLVWIPGNTLWFVRIDPSQVDQLLANLTVNARDAMDGSGKIVIETGNVYCDEVTCRRAASDAKPGEYVMLAVSDDGCGMEKETLANIFEPFFTTKKDGRGTGLGLATVYGIVRQNEGFIAVDTVPEEGTTFRIYLPRQISGKPAVPAAKKTELPRGRESILLVEDEESVLHLAQNMLETLGYAVFATTQPGQALRLAGDPERKIDLLLTDVVMPGMNGRELSEKIAVIRPEIKCLFMSGYTADVIAREGVLEENVQFLQKPFSLRDLAVKVRSVLETNRL